jgi:hypothetical protein
MDRLSRHLKLLVKVVQLDVTTHVAIALTVEIP